jgi:hypothetical protein
VRLFFDPGDDGVYYRARDALLDELDAWLEMPDPERGGVVADVEFFLDWRFRDSSGVLDEFSPSDVAEFLLEWCPHRLRGRADAADYLCSAVGVYVDFMAATGRLVGGVDRAARLRRLAEDLAPTVRAEMRNPTPVVDLSQSDEEDEKLQAAMQEIDERFGANADRGHRGDVERRQSDDGLHCPGQICYRGSRTDGSSTAGYPGRRPCRAVVDTA